MTHADVGGFRDTKPDLAQAAQDLFYQFGVGLAFLATVRRDGGPRVHPMCPLITGTGLYAFIVPGPKRNDLLRDGRYAMHGFPPANNEDAVSITGTVRHVVDVDLRTRLSEQFFRERSWTEEPPGWADQVLFEFLLETCLITRTTGHGDHNPQHTVWKA